MSGAASDSTPSPIRTGVALAKKVRLPAWSSLVLPQLTPKEFQASRPSSSRASRESRCLLPTKRGCRSTKPTVSRRNPQRLESGRACRSARNQSAEPRPFGSFVWEVPKRSSSAVLIRQCSSILGRARPYCSRARAITRSCTCLSQYGAFRHRHGIESPLLYQLSYQSARASVDLLALKRH
jgi:hypothetical protein